MSSSASSAPVAAASSSDRSAFYKQLVTDVRQQLSAAPSSDPISLCANIASLIYHSFSTAFPQPNGLKPVNWAGFYFVRSLIADMLNIAEDAEEDADAPRFALVLGPFHGLPAVAAIRIGKGVCGSAVAARQTQLVPDVHARADHIACDSASQSELVVPLFTQDPVNGRSAPIVVAAVLDLDSPVLGFWSEQDVQPMESIAQMLQAKANFTHFLTEPISVMLPHGDTCSMSAKGLKEAH